MPNVKDIPPGSVVRVDQKEDNERDEKLSRSTGLPKIDIKMSISLILQSATDDDRSINMNPGDVGLVLATCHEYAILLVKGRLAKTWVKDDQSFLML